MNAAIDDTSLVFGDVSLPGVPVLTMLLERAAYRIGQAQFQVDVKLAVERAIGLAEGYQENGGITASELQGYETELTRMANDKLAAIAGRRA